MDRRSGMTHQAHTIQPRNFTVILRHTTMRGHIDSSSNSGHIMI